MVKLLKARKIDLGQIILVHIFFVLTTYSLEFLDKNQKLHVFNKKVNMS